MAIWRSPEQLENVINITNRGKLIKLHLVRHGQTNWNAEKRIQGQSESQLTDTGRQQAERLRPVIEKLGINAVYSSTSERTRETEAILTTNLEAPVTYLDSLREINLGPWETRLWEEVHQQNAEQAELFHTKPHLFNLADAETFVQLQRRGVDAIMQIIENEDVDQVLLVSHGALLKAVLVHFGGIELARMWENPVLDNCSHSVLEAWPGGQHQVHSIGGHDPALIGWLA